MVDYGTTGEYGYRPWPVNYPDDRPVWTVTYQGGEVAGTIAQPCQISVRLADGSEPELAHVVAADPSLPPLVRAAKAAREHVRLFMEPHGWLGDDDEACSVVLALDLITQPPEQRPDFIDRWTHYQVMTFDQVGLTLDAMYFDNRLGSAGALTLLAPLMTQDRNAATLIRAWASKVSYALVFDTADQADWPTSDRWSVKDFAAQFDGLGERERTLLVQALDGLTREATSPYGDLPNGLIGAWERLTDDGPHPLGLRGRVGLYSNVDGDLG
jgi:hypothetical protein